MRKFGVFCVSIFSCIIVAGLYGIVHDQVTYSISPEYFTKFKYRQFGFDPVWFGGHRLTVAVIGFLATWWTGIFIGLGLGLTSLIFREHKAMQDAIKKGLIYNFCTAILFGVIGFFYGKFVLVKTGVDWWLPADLRDKQAFITVGSIHNFSYLGGLFGLMIGIFIIVKAWSIQQKTKSNTLVLKNTLKANL